MRVAQRLYLAIAPGVLGMMLVAALAYWGERGRAAPEWLLLVAAVAVTLSLVLTWRNTRYVAERLERIAEHLPASEVPTPWSPIQAAREVANPRGSVRADEIDSVAGAMVRLSTEASSARATMEARSRDDRERIREYANLMAETAAAVALQLDQIRLPLHILLENHFGPLSENQEDMLGAARTAADGVDLELRRLTEIAAIDRGIITVRRDVIPLGDLFRPLEPGLRAEAERHGVALSWRLDPDLPRIVGDRRRLQEALSLLLGYYVRHSAKREVDVAVVSTSTGASLEIGHTEISSLGPEFALARRVILGQGVTLDVGSKRTIAGFRAIGSLPGSLAGRRPPS